LFRFRQPSVTGPYPPRHGSPTAWARSCTGPWSSSSSCRRLGRLWAVNMLARQRHTSAPSPSTPPPPAAMIAPTGTLPGSHSSQRVPFFLQTPRQALHGPGWLTGSARSTLHCPGRGEAVAAPVTTPSGREHKQRRAPRLFVASSARPGRPASTPPGDAGARRRQDALDWHRRRHCAAAGPDCGGP
jgi:hypothetical protein